MDQLIYASLFHTHYWYEVGMLKVQALQLFKIKKGNKKVVFTARSLGGVCTLYSIRKYVQCIHSSLLHVLDSVVTNNTS